MYPQFETISNLLTANAHRALLATRNASGLPHISPELIGHWDENAIWFAKFPGARTLENLARFPDAAISVVDWKSFRGLQVKGRVTLESTAPENSRAPQIWHRLAARGINQYARLEIMEVFDVIPSEGRNLATPLWKKAPRWASSTTAPSFSSPDISPRPQPEPFRRLFAEMVTRLRASHTPAFIATVDDTGMPNISPRFLLEIGEDYWFYGDGFRNKTFMNAARPSALAVTLVDWEKEQGFMAQGWAEMRYTGEWLAKIRSSWNAMNFKANAVQAVLFHPEIIEEIGLSRPSIVFKGNPIAGWVPQPVDVVR